MTCPDGNGLSCNDYGISLPCGPLPPYNPDVPPVAYAGPLVVTGTDVTAMWDGEDLMRVPGDTIQFIVMAKAYHKLYQYQEEPDVAAGTTGIAVIPFPVEIAVVYKVSVRRLRNGQVGDWNSQFIFYGGNDYTYLVDEAGDYLVMDDDDTVYLVVEDVPDPKNWAYDPDGNIMLDPDGNPVEKQ